MATTVGTSATRERWALRSLSNVVLGRLAGLRTEALLLAGLTIFAAVPRLVLLTKIPPGLHGDEGWTGLDAERILREGWIGPYVGSALGQPAGPLYFVAPFEKLFGPDVLAVRLPMAVLATATVPLAYLAFRTMFSRTVGIFAAVLLAVSLWHLHYSRIGFMVISWPLVELITLAFLFWGIRNRSLFAFAAAGLSFGAGIYTYNAYPVFALPVAVALLWFATAETGRNLSRGWLRAIARPALCLTLFAVMAVIAALPMIQYAADPQNGYLNHHRTVSVFESEEWKSKDAWEKLTFSLGRVKDFYSAVFWKGEPDGADAAGARAMVDRASVVLVAAGLLMLASKWRNPAAATVLAAFVFLPFASEFTYNALFRRSLGLVPFLAVIAAVPLAALWDRARSFAREWQTLTRVAVAGVVALIGYQALTYYFRDFPDTSLARFTFAVELAKASEYMQDLPDDTYVYFYSARWGFGYETRRYLAAGVEGEDRSREFGTFDLRRTRDTGVAYVLLAPYEEYLSQLTRLYPGGIVTESRHDGTVEFVAYYLPPEERGP
ncbi:MAG TPA: glycosyltransferase family 39 protein [Dehalococcoidia bacterium]|nr:glycosyltransferase family 39 protein [Dehalococcoidia bacterium]